MEPQINNTAVPRRHTDTTTVTTPSGAPIPGMKQPKRVKPNKAADLQSALNDFSKAEETYAPSKKSLMEGEKKNEFVIETQPAGVIITDTKTKSGKLKRAVSGSINAWINTKKKQVQKMTEPKPVETGERVAPASSRVRVINKAVKADRLATSTNAPANKAVIKKRVLKNRPMGPHAMIKKKSEVAAPQWGSAQSEPAVRVTEKKFKPETKIIPQPKREAEAMGAAQTVQKTFRRPNQTVQHTLAPNAPAMPAAAPAASEQTIAWGSDRITTPEVVPAPKPNPATATTSVVTPPPTATERVVTPKPPAPTLGSAAVTPTIEAQKPEEPQSGFATTPTMATPAVQPTVTNVETAVQNSETVAAPPVPPAVAQPAAPRTQQAVRQAAAPRAARASSFWQERRALVLAGGVVTLAVVIIITGIMNFAASRQTATPELAAQPTLFASEQVRTVTASETVAAMENMRELAASNQGLTSVHFANDSQILDSSLVGFPTYFGITDRDPFIVIETGSFETGLGIMLSLERNLPPSLSTLFAGGTRGAFMDESASLPNVRSNGQLSYHVTGGGRLIISSSAQSVTRVFSTLR